ncbi:MAG TPA: DEAD/DEAH box helicase [Bacteroidia bacterium]|nr:DEAD/DEAH box helicase [Bacteroidia bacterium]
MSTFKDLGLNSELQEAVGKLGFETPTPIQLQAIPALIEGPRDMIGLAQTGTGKTAAFGLPLLQTLDFSKKATSALILAPTRELCVQITSDLKKFASFMPGVRITAVYGGASIQGQISELRRGAHIISATPGRLIDLIERGAVRLADVDVVVLDEADEMLNMGFQEDIDQILSETPATRNTWLFSATMPSGVRSIASRYMKNPFELSMGKKNAGAENITHVYYTVHSRDRYQALKRLVDFNPSIFGIVFCRTKIESQEIAEKLIKDGYNADALHGDLSQQQRDKVMGRFRQRSMQLLIATDVAARGIDVSDVTHVINYELPDDTEVYTHRSGRTARAGKSGISVSIVNMREIGKIRELERTMKVKFKHEKVPDGFAICEKQLIHLVHRVHDVEVDEASIAGYLPGIYEELADLSKEEVIKRFTSLEFNRFLDYYRNAPDVNADAERGRGGDNTMKRPGMTRMFINLGSADGLDAGRMLRYLCETAGIKGEQIGRMDIKGVYSFIDIDEQAWNSVLEAYKGEIFKGRRVRVDLSEKGGGGGGSRRSGDRGPRKDFGDRGEQKGKGWGKSERSSQGGDRYKGKGGGKRYRN